MITVHAIQTGSVRIKRNQYRRRDGAWPPLAYVLFGAHWTDWLPIYAWAIEHADGVVVVDTGETARVMERGYFPGWQPYYRLAVEFDVKPEDEIGPQLKLRGIDPGDVKTVVLSHLHTDHAGGLHHFPNSRILVHPGEYRRAQGLGGKLNGYLPHRWPAWFKPEPLTFDGPEVEPFGPCCNVTSDGIVKAILTPGHTPFHVSVVVRENGLSYLLAGDATYSQKNLADGRIDGVSHRKSATATYGKLKAYCREHPTVFLPSHDPESATRLERNKTVDV